MLLFKLSSSFVALAATVQACTSEIYGRGTCNEPKTVDAKQVLSTEDLQALAACFRGKYGDRYTIDGPTIPDFGGLGNAWGVQMLSRTPSGDKTIQMSVGNLCGCTNTMVDNILDVLIEEGAGHDTIVINCGGQNCGDLSVPAGMYANAGECIGPQDCGASYQKWEICPDFTQPGA